VYPAQHHEVLTVAVVEDVGLVDRLACVGGGFLVGDQQFGHEKGVGDESAAEEAACFEIAVGIGAGDGEELGAEVRREKHGAKRSATFEICGWLEGKSRWMEVCR
jgi:hypothetical protein